MRPVNCSLVRNAIIKITFFTVWRALQHTLDAKVNWSTICLCERKNGLWLECISVCALIVCFCQPCVSFVRCALQEKACVCAGEVCLRVSVPICFCFGRFWKAVCRVMCCCLWGYGDVYRLNLPQTIRLHFTLRLCTWPAINQKAGSEIKCTLH